MEKIIQATAIEFKGQAVLIIGPSGIGKTSLALKLIEKGARLISDDVSIILLKNNELYIKVKPELYGKIELRELGIIQGMNVCPIAPLACVIHLTKEKNDRWPRKQKYKSFFGQKVPVFDFFACETTDLWVLYVLKVLNGELTLLKE